MKDTDTTKDQFLDVARKLFSEKGFYGVSIAAISGELGLTKQALLHHFGSKEKLYGLVLEQLSERFMLALKDGPDTLHDAIRRLFGHMLHEKEDARIVMRELLDNTERAEKSRKWYMRPFLDHLVVLGKQHPNWAQASEEEIFARIYQMLGAMNYWAISGPTLGRMYGPEIMKGVSEAYLGTLLEDL